MYDVGKYHTKKCNCIIAAAIVIVGLILASALWFLAAKVITVNLVAEEIAVDLKEKVLCPAKSMASNNNSLSQLTLNIPPNVAITKIYASVRQSAGNPIDNANLFIQESGTIFFVAINKDPNASVGYYETTFVQPLCIGSDGAILVIESLTGNSPVNAQALRLTVVYCSDYCDE